MKTQYRHASTLGSLALGLLTAAVASGCGSDASSTKPNTAHNGTIPIPAAAAITARSIAVDGCNVTGTFDIVSPKVISFVAFDTSDFEKSSSSENSSNFQLTTIDDTNTSTAISQAATEADSDQEAMFNSMTNNTTAAMASLKQKAETEAKKSAETTTTLEEQASVKITNDNESHSSTDAKSTHKADNEANQLNTAAAKSANQTETANVSTQKAAEEQKTKENSEVSFVKFVPPTFITFESKFSAAAEAAKSAFVFNAIKAQTKSTNDTATLSASQVESHILDTTQFHTEQEANNHFTLDTEKQLKTTTTTKENSDIQSADSLETAKNDTTTAKATTDQSSKNTTKTKTFVFNSLSTFNSHRFVLTVKVTASQAQELLRIFQASSSALNSFRDFPVSTPACVVPVVSPKTFL